MVSYDDLTRRARADYLDVFGGFQAQPDDPLPTGTKTVILLGPYEPGFWAHLTASPEARDGKPDPIDRWSRRVIGALATALGATALFPFDGPPWFPFLGWAQRTGRAWSSPVNLLVHDTAGLMVSYRGALALQTPVALPTPPAQRPCDTCSAPCLTACPATALRPDGYDTKACHAYLDTGPGADCMTHGCAVRRACPISQSYGRRPEQSAAHMRSFHPCPSS